MAARRHVRTRIWFTALILLIAASVVWPEHYKIYAAFSGEGEGTADSPYLIRTAAQLDEVRNDPGAHYRLEADIDLAAAGYTNWSPIGTWNSNPFSGTFDGNGYTIANLRITGTANYVGLFGYVKEARIRHVGLIGADVGGTQYVGGLAGKLESAVVEEVYMTGSVTGTAGSSALGGLAGNVSGIVDSPAIIRYTYAAATVNGSERIGGLIGAVEGSASVALSYYDNSLTPVSAAGTGATAAAMKQRGTFGESWRFWPEAGASWAIMEGETYPMHLATYNRLMLDNLTATGDSGPIVLEPGFASAHRAYSIRVRGDVGSVAVSATPKNDASTAAVNGGTDSETIILSPGSNTVSIVVSTADVALPGVDAGPFLVAYTLTVIREDGSDDYPHNIATAEQLASIGTGPFLMSDHYRLLNDLDLASIPNWQPIGSGADPFAGHFDGDSHVIYNLNIEREDEDGVGLFGYSRGTIENIGLERVNVTGRNRVGALVGHNLGGGAGDPQGSLLNVYASGNVSGNDNVGGLIGLNEHGVAHAYYTGTVAGGGTKGGLIGAAGADASVIDAYWDVDVSGLAESAGGEGKSTAELRQRATFGLDFAGRWAIINGSTYPMWKRVFDQVNLSGLAIVPPAGEAAWDAVFEPGQGTYTVTLNRYVKEAAVTAIPADTGASVTVGGENGIAVTVDVLIGDNAIPIAVDGADGLSKGSYTLHVIVPAPALTGVTIPASGYYGAGDTLTFAVQYEDDVDVAGTPRIPLLIGAETAYADYVGQPEGALGTLIFEYTVSEDAMAPEGIAIGAAIELPPGASLTALGHNVALALAAPDAGGIRLDTAAPVIAGVADGEAYNTDRRIEFADATAVTATLNGEPFADGDTVSAEGEHTLTVTDAAGNSATVIFTIDKTAPAVIGVADGEVYNADRRIEFADATAVTATLNGEPFADGDTVSAEGEHTLTVTDAAGNSATVIFTIDKTAPGVVGVADGEAYNTDRRIEFADATAVTATLNGAPFIGGDTVSAEGEHTLTVTDAAGNSATVTFTIDKTAPGVVGVADGEAYNADRRIEFADATAVTATLNGTPFIGGDTVSAEGEYTLTVTDAAGNSATVIFTIDKTAPAVIGVADGEAYNADRRIEFADATAVTATLNGAPFADGGTVSAEGEHTLTATDAAGNSATVTFTIDKTAPAVIGVADGEAYNTDRRIEFADATAVTATLNGEPFADGDTVSAEGEYTLTVTDAAGNSATVTFTIDKTAPAVAGVQDGGVYPAGVAIEFDEGTATLNGEPFASGSRVRTPGNHRLLVTDRAGNVTTVDFRVYVPVAVPPKPMIDLNGTPFDPDRIDTTKPSVTLRVTPKDGVARVLIPDVVLTSLYGKNAVFVIEIEAPYGSYRVPVDLAQIIPGLQELYTANRLEARDIGFRITLADKSGDPAILSALASGLPRGSVMGAIVDFRIDMVNTNTGATIGTADSFTRALTRVIPMPEEMTDMPAQWGAFRYDEATATFGFVAARQERIDGKWYIPIRSYTNSAYVVADHPASFADMLLHWGRPYVELAAAKGLVAGTGERKYTPDRTVTRAEFAAMLVRALGRGPTAAEAAPYDDVRPGMWHFAEVAAAKRLGLLGFAAGSLFAPDQPLAREEMAHMLAQAIRLEASPLRQEYADLDRYRDIDSAAAAYLEDIHLTVQMNIMTGTDADLFRPKGTATRAQAATVLVRTLRTLGLIDGADAASLPPLRK